MIAPDPLHRFGLADFPHPALTSSISRMGRAKPTGYWPCYEKKPESGDSAKVEQYINCSTPPEYT
jgi:hypothetical protein